MGSSSSDDDGRGRSAAAGADGGGAVVVVGGGGGGGGKHGRLKSVCWSESRERGKRESARERLQTEASLASRESEWCRYRANRRSESCRTTAAVSQSYRLLQPQPVELGDDDDRRWKKEKRLGWGSQC